MKHKVTAKLEYTFIVDTDSEQFKQYIENRKGEYDLIISYARTLLSWSIIDDQGYCAIGPLTFRWRRRELDS